MKPAIRPIGDRWRRRPAAVLAVSFAVLCGHAAGQITGPTIQPGDPAPCRLCHGAEGSGKVGINAPRLAGQYAPYLLGQLQDFASGDRPSRLMSPIAHRLTEAEMASMAEVFSEQEAPVGPRPEPKPSQVQKGKTIAMRGTADGRVQPCSDCHGTRGLGDPPLIPYIAGQLPDYLEHALKSFRSGERESDPYRIMRHVASGLTDDQIRALAAYYGSLPPRGAEQD